MFVSLYKFNLLNFFISLLILSLVSLAPPPPHSPTSSNSTNFNPDDFLQLSPDNSVFNKVDSINPIGPTMRDENHSSFVHMQTVEEEKKKRAREKRLKYQKDYRTKLKMKGVKSLNVAGKSELELEQSRKRRKEIILERKQMSTEEKRENRRKMNRQWHTESYYRLKSERGFGNKRTWTLKEIRKKIKKGTANQDEIDIIEKENNDLRKRRERFNLKKLNSNKE